MKNKLISVGLWLLLSGCMLNNDWHQHFLELNTIDNILLVDGVNSGEMSYEISSDSIGITFQINEKIDAFTWVWNVNNDIRYEAIVNGIEVYVPHNFKLHKQDTFKAITYLETEHIHFIKNWN